MFSKHDVVLFQGDSITDAGRNREKTAPNDTGGLGTGYAYLTTARMLQDFADLELKILNRGISGNKVWQLEERWQADCLDLKPALVSILIGINDTWHGQRDPAQGVPLGRYESIYRNLLQKTGEQLPGVRFVLCEPFALRCGAVTDTWFPDIDDRRAIVRKLAQEFKAVFVPFQAAFDKAIQATRTPPTYWAHDGVHPSIAGHSLMSQTWLEYVFGSADL